MCVCVCLFFLRTPDKLNVSLFGLTKLKINYVCTGSKIYPYYVYHTVVFTNFGKKRKI